MKAKLYDLMNWAQIEGVVYSEEDKPGTILGPHPAGSSTLYQAFFPDAKKVTLILEDKEKRVSMEMADEEGFFAATAAGKKIGPYSYEVVTKDGKKVLRKDPYAFTATVDQEELNRFNAGTNYDVYKIFGSHEVEINKTKGVQFTVWAPGAVRVSVIGEFNDWDGRITPMNRVDGSDVFTVFVPGMDASAGYQYELKAKDGRISVFNDPYADREVTKERTVSKVHVEKKFTWADKKWITDRKIKEDDFKVFAWEESKEKDAAVLSKQLKEQGFNHVSLPAFYLSSNFYQMVDYFTSEKDVKDFVNEMHKAGIGVLFNWNAACCYELNKSQVSNFFIANVLYWVEEFHMDGLIFSELESLLYLDFGKAPGQWTPNMYGGNENLEGIEFVKHTNSILTNRNKEIILLADIDAIWPKVTAPMEEGGLGFHYRYDTAFTRDLIGYLTTDPYNRSAIHEKITSRMGYAYNEKFVMAFPAKAVHDLWNWIPGEEKDKFSTIKAAFAYLSFLPGKMLSGFEVPEAMEKDYAALVKKCHELNSKTDILAKEDYNDSNFSWINCFQQKECTVSFLRKDVNEEGSLLVVANFANDEKPEFMIGVPYEGKYELIFDTEEAAFGGSKKISKEAIFTQEDGWDGYAQKINVSLSPLSVSVYRYIPFTEDEIYAIAEKKADKIREEIMAEAKAKVELLKKLRGIK